MPRGNLEQRERVRAQKKELDQEFVKRLKKKVAEHELTHDQMAHITGCSRSAVSMWLSGHSGIMMKDSLLLAEFFKIQVPKHLTKDDDVEDEGDEASV